MTDYTRQRDLCEAAKPHITIAVLQSMSIYDVRFYNAAREWVPKLLDEREQHFKTCESAVNLTGAMQHEIKILGDENTRLREALEQIEEGTTAPWITKKARAALAPEEVKP